MKEERRERKAIEFLNSVQIRNTIGIVGNVVQV